ncbi:MAG: hypothetical protein ACRC50_06070 [Gaiella sp.]
MVESLDEAGRRVLLVSTVELGPDAVAELVGPAAETVVVVPAVEQSRLQWLTNEEDEARDHAASAAAEMAATAPGETTVARAGDPSPLLAIEDALREFDATEVVVVTRTGDDASWLEHDSGEAASSLVRLPLVHVRRD